MRMLKKTDKTTITRHDERGSYDRDLAYQIIDEALVAHVGFDTGRGVTVIPMTYARSDDRLFLHGAVASRWLSSFAGEGHDICVTITILDGLVLAKSAFSHSMNYRSVVAFGRATVVDAAAEKGQAFKALLDHLVPGRWDDSRQPDEKESNATTVLRMEIREASVKMRSGPPIDSDKDQSLDYWTGVIPLAVTADDPIATVPASAVPDYIIGYKRS